MEITSPGGMIDGSFIQNLDINKISSIRRNRIISDIFNRLHLMERRGSGLIRIIESYNDYEIKPTFHSDISTFKVTFPNKGYAPANEEEKIIISNHNFVNDKDYFMIKMYKSLPDGTRKSTYNQILSLFEKYTYQYNFNRENIEELFKIKKSRASEIIKLLINYDLIEAAEPTKYRFKK